jgi:hypothetical protein
MDLPALCTRQSICQILPPLDCDGALIDSAGLRLTPEAESVLSSFFSPLAIRHAIACVHCRTQFGRASPADRAHGGAHEVREVPSFDIREMDAALPGGAAALRPVRSMRSAKSARPGVTPRWPRCSLPEPDATHGSRPPNVECLYHGTPIAVEKGPPSQSCSAIGRETQPRHEFRRRTVCCETHRNGTE